MRRRLSEYYADEGRDDAVRLDLPRGSDSVVSTYAVPPVAETVGEKAAAPATTAVDHAPVRKRSGWRRIRTAVVVAAVIVGGAIIVSQQREVACPWKRPAAMKKTWRAP